MSERGGKRIAIVGSGIAGLTAAWYLSRDHEITVFEANDYAGGHTHTCNVEVDGRRFPVNTGFIVFNDWTYPGFIRLLEELDVVSEPSSMSFSVRCQESGFEYMGSTLNSLFAQRSNLLRPGFYRMIGEILRFNREATRDLQRGLVSDTATVGEYLRQNGYSTRFRRFYILPMASAIWSASEAEAADFPLAFFLRFFANHGMLSVDDRPQWRVISGGSARYVDRIADHLGGRLLLNRPIRAVRRYDNQVGAVTADGEEQHFDEVILACHSDQALRLLARPGAAERAILGAIGYRDNQVTLHTDIRHLPRRKRAWASWNYAVPADPEAPPVLTYNMNILQNLRAPKTFCVTLNHDEGIDEREVLARYRYSHPVYSRQSAAAQRRFAEISGVGGIHYCGAYWFNGFHEDGVRSALRVVKAIGSSACLAA